MKKWKMLCIFSFQYLRGFFTLTKANFVESESTPYNGMCEIFGKNISKSNVEKYLK